MNKVVLTVFLVSLFYWGCSDSGTSELCGNSKIDEGETCDPPGTCLTTCDDSDPCTTDSLSGNAEECNVECTNSAITDCADDGCCPAGCHANNDNDCSPVCGNNEVETGETCDPPASCPTECDGANPCQTGTLTGDPADCTAECQFSDITDCIHADGCCPATCNANSDDDCQPVCGNDAIEAGETCDPPASCPTDCDDSDPCTSDTLTGSDANCDADCTNAPITDCINDDGCCPATCDENSDNDCGLPAEICTGGNDEDGDGFTDCLDLDCFGDPACTEACAGGPIPVQCGDSLAGDTSGEANTLSWYNCLEWDETGGEIVYRLTPAQAQDATVTLTPGPGVDVDIFVLEADCRQDNCIAHDDIETTFSARPGVDYFLVVDSFEGLEGAFSIDVACDPIEEDCNNGVDDDFDTQVDCADNGCSADPACPGDGHCITHHIIRCANTISAVRTTADTLDATDAIDSYSCIGWAETGPEVAWEFTSPIDGQVHVSIEYDATERDLDLFVLEDMCAGDHCVQHGDESLSFAAVNGTTYYFVIDGRNGDSGNFVLRVDCELEEGSACVSGLDEDSDGLTDCDDPQCFDSAWCPTSGECYNRQITIDCGEELTGDNHSWGSSDVVDAYNCTGNSLAGPESVVLYPSAGSGPATATITADSTGGQLEILVLEDTCDGTSCLSHGADSAVFTTQDGHDYFIVVDAPEGVVGTYSIQLDCSFEDCSDFIDNDGDGDVDCDDSDCQGGYWCPPGVCQQDGTIGCDETLAVTATGEPNEVMYYSCLGQMPLVKGEAAYLFTTDTPVEVVATMSPPGIGARWLGVLKGECAGEACLMMGWAMIIFNAVPGESYYIVAEGDGDYNLSTTCSPASEVCANGEDDDANGTEDCDDPACAGAQACPTDGRCVPDPQTYSIGCGQQSYSSTSRWGATDVLDGYECTDWDASGPEVVYTFIPEVSGSVTVDLSHSSGIALDVYILQGNCTSDACIAAGGTSLTFDVLQGKTYYIVVDGANGDAGMFTLAVSCFP